MLIIGHSAIVQLELHYNVQ